MTKLKELFRKDKTELAVMCILFLLGTAAYFMLGKFSKAIEIYMDELFYYDMGRGIFNGNGLLINNYMSSFEKIAYPLVIAPLFAIEDGVLRVNAIALLNSALMMSCIFPVRLIVKELGVSRKYRYILLLITVIYPDMMYSVTFMSEVIYWPILLFFIYVWILSAKAPKPHYAAFLAALAYAAYLCKEIAIALPLAYIAFEIIYPVLSYLVAGKEERKKFTEYFSKKRFVNCVIFLALFFALFAVMKLTVFGGGSSNYSLSRNSSLLQDPFEWMYMVKAMLYYIAMIIISSYVLPVVYPLIRYRSMDEGNRRLYCFTAILCFIIKLKEKCKNKESFAWIIYLW